MTARQPLERHAVRAEPRRQAGGGQRRELADRRQSPPRRTSNVRGARADWRRAGRDRPASASAESISPASCSRTASGTSCSATSGSPTATIHPAAGAGQQRSPSTAKRRWQPAARRHARDARQSMRRRRTAAAGPRRRARPSRRGAVRCAARSRARSPSAVRSPDRHRARRRRDSRSLRIGARGLGARGSENATGAASFLFAGAGSLETRALDNRRPARAPAFAPGATAGSRAREHVGRLDVGDRRREIVVRRDGHDSSRRRTDPRPVAAAPMVRTEITRGLIVRPRRRRSRAVLPAHSAPRSRAALERNRRRRRDFARRASAPISNATVGCPRRCARSASRSCAETGAAPAGARRARSNATRPKPPACSTRFIAFSARSALPTSRTHRRRVRSTPAASADTGSKRSWVSMSATDFAAAAAAAAIASAQHRGPPPTSAPTISERWPRRSPPPSALVEAGDPVAATPVVVRPRPGRDRRQGDVELPGPQEGFEFCAGRTISPFLRLAMEYTAPFR